MNLCINCHCSCKGGLSRNEWARCWVDLGTSDALTIDILINCLFQIDVDFVQIEELWIGGVNDDWPVDDHPDAIFS